MSLSRLAGDFLLRPRVLSILDGNSKMKKKLAMIIGGSRGIGAACVEAFVKEEYDVAYTYTAKATEGGPGKAYQLDVTDSAAVGAVFEAVARDFGRAPDVVVHSAGISPPLTPLAQFDPKLFRQIVDVNLIGAFSVLAEAARCVADGGAIIPITTSMGRAAIPGSGPYVGTKVAAEAMVKALARELAVRKVRVNAVAPGPVDTELFRAGKSDDAKARSAALSPLNRVGEAHEVANVILFLASDKASWVTGQVVQPNGGML